MRGVEVGVLPACGGVFEVKNGGVSMSLNTLSSNFLLGVSSTPWGIFGKCHF